MMRCHNNSLGSPGDPFLVMEILPVDAILAGFKTPLFRKDKHEVGRKGI